jgi:hypothetical protein
MMRVVLTIWRILTYGIGRRRKADHRWQREVDQQWHRDLASWLEDDEVKHS